MKLGWRSAFSASFSMVQSAFILNARIFAPNRRRYGGLDGTDRQANSNRFSLPHSKLCFLRFRLIFPGASAMSFPAGREFAEKVRPAVQSLGIHENDANGIVCVF